MPKTVAIEVQTMISGLESAGMTRTEIAEAAHVSRNTVWRYANGEVREPTYEAVWKIAKIYTARCPDTEGRN